MRPFEDADKNGGTVEDFSVMMIAIDLGPQQIGKTDRLSDQLSHRLIPRYQPSDVRSTQCTTVAPKLLSPATGGRTQAAQCLTYSKYVFTKFIKY
ncbi:hypothetical protein TNCV_695731 [Trichonephila clavipes]|nr:hypothetical protein TNCV_695731 [Trichonephila clavipes]